MADEISQPAQPSAKPSATVGSSRPMGVTIICILVLLGAIFSIIGGATSVMLSGMMAVLMPGLGVLTVGIGAVTIIIGIIYLLCFWWLWKMLKKGYKFTMIISVISLILSVIGMNIIGVVLSIIILAYLYMKRALFV